MRPLKIAFDVTTCTKARLGGIGTYAWSLVQACARVAPQHRYGLAVRPHRWTRRRLLKDLLPGTRPRLLLDGLARFAFRDLDVFHGLGVRLPAGVRFPRVVTVHDINVFEFPELSEPQWRTTRQAKIRQTLARADVVIAYSKQGAHALGEYLGFPRERVRVVPCGVDTGLFSAPPADRLAETLQRHDLHDRPYVLHVGTYSPRKNQDGLLRAFARAALPDPWVLMLAGPTGDAAAGLRHQAAKLGLPAGRLLLPGWVSDADLPALLAGAGMVVCASLHEGFGLPVLEAQACGAPVVSSDRGALPETLGDVGLTFDPTDTDAFAEALRRMASDEALAERCRLRGPERVRQHYTWEHVARATLAVYEQATGG